MNPYKPSALIGMAAGAAIGLFILCGAFSLEREMLWSTLFFGALALALMALVWLCY